MEFKCRLKVIFAEEGIVAGEFADEVGISRSTLSLYMNDKNLPKFEIAYIIGRKLGKNIEDIWIIMEEDKHGQA